jgi:hypothetical protein
MQGALTQLHHGGFLLKSSAGFPGAINFWHLKNRQRGLQIGVGSRLRVQGIPLLKCPIHQVTP